MKLFPVLLLNAGLTLAIVAGYHVLASGPAPVQSSDDPVEFDTTELDARVARVERDVKSWAMKFGGRRDGGSLDAITARLERLERGAGSVGATADVAHPAGDGATAAMESSAESSGEVATVSDAEVRVVRAALEKIEKERHAEREKSRLEQMLERAGVQVPEKHQAFVMEKIDAARDGMRDRMRAHFENGGEREGMRDVIQAGRDELAGELATVLSSEDAAALAATLSPRGGPRGDSRRGRGDR